MRAAVCRAFGAPLRIEEAAIRPPGPEEVLVRIAACAVCHSDVAFIDGAWGGMRTGAFAEFVTVDASQVVAVPQAVPLAAASLLACGVLTGIGAVRNTAAVEPGSTGLYLAGRLKLDELISGRFGFDRINDAIDSARAGQQLRPVLVLGQ
ncbi:MAG: hypothetical protein LBI49_24115 [Nocardiopsaceae bacterium]|jgi:Zn-dependent alcohol dehydrogenase|nr:hypothetical protein [Nocardiopsaceae bacterium]